MKPEDVPAPTREHVHTWFSLSYSNYAILPRTLLQSMPDEWQARFVTLMDELSDAFAHIDHAPGYEVNAGDWVYVNECTPEQLKAAGVTSSDDDLDPEAEDYPEGYETVYHDADGNEMGPVGRVFVAGSDPVPHYNRGRTYIAPRIARGGPMKPAEQLPAIDAQPVVTVEQYAAALRAEIVAWITGQQHRCARHDDIDRGMAVNCAICWWNGAIDGAAQLARGQHGPTAERVAERLRRGGV